MERKISSEEIIKEAINHCESWPPMVGGGPDQYSWAPLACIDQSKNAFYIFTVFQIFKKKKTRGIEIQGVTKYKYKKKVVTKLQFLNL